MLNLDSDIRTLKGIGEKKALAFNKLGVFSLSDLLFYFPAKYEDRTIISDIISAPSDRQVCIFATVADTPKLSRIRRGLDLVRLRVVDDSSSMEITFFNQPYVKDLLHRGENYIFFGKVEHNGHRHSMTNPSFEPEKASASTGKLLPLYRLSSGLTQKNLRMAIQQSLQECSEALPDPIPEEILARNHLCRRSYAVEMLHFPADYGALAIARKRMIFEELFLLSCALGRFRTRNMKFSSFPINDSTGNFYPQLPFSPTNAQKKAVSEALKDMGSGHIMNRLVQGDVGSGKTLVAAALIHSVAISGHLSAFMAPTEILAEQHYGTFCALFEPFGLHIGKLTGSMSAKEKRQVKAQLENGELDLIVGTHALFSADVNYRDLALVVTDEQHRFGVAQRSSLVQKGADPHVLVMSATPIPRTLALIIYGDLDVSILNELPPGRQKVDTFRVTEAYRERLNTFIRKLVSEGRQVFVVCPMVEENDELLNPLKSAEEHAAQLALEFPDLSVSCIHGKMKAAEKDRVMGQFARGETNILVATTVIEVGVDIPNAALMIIENAERFGLSQLHQLRGRVGRGKHKSYCVLVSDSKGEDAAARLDTMCRSSDGFEIAEEDLRLRGPGDFFGSRQHGLPEMHIADLGADVETLKTAQAEAALLLKTDPELLLSEHQLLSEHVRLLFQKNENNFN